ncbi:MAG: hypothetical protein LUH00_11045 [Lachnospiraceae bacterium]|nr:hypothetical protein [Lachnospiraceae bacterium]
MKRENILRLLLGVMIAATLMILASSTVMAATKRKSVWYTSERQNYYYFDKTGHKLKDGKYKIKGKYYYFDEKGRQRTGWQKIGDSYYYFNIANKKKGYMLTSTTVNGIHLGADGKAEITSYSKEKLPILYQANVLMRSITKPRDTKEEKLKKCFEWIKSNLKYCNIGSFHKQSDWDIYYAKRIFISGYVTADCYTCGVVFAYLANAVGYSVNAVSSGGHGWAEIGNYVYDPNWSVADKTHNYFGMPYGTTGKNVPNYAKNRYYVITI